MEDPKKASSEKVILVDCHVRAQFRKNPLAKPNSILNLKIRRSSFARKLFLY